jgi:hypothetical protein
MLPHPLLLELSAWPWLDRLSRREGTHITLENVPGKEWDRIRRDGFSLVFLMGVWSRSSLGRELARTDPGLVRDYDRVLPGWSADDVAGSPYCIDAYEPDPRMGGWAGLAAARTELRARGIGLILDFIPNHTGFDHPWVRQHPQRYVLGTEEDVRAEPEDFRAVDSVQGRVHVACGRDPYFPPWRDVAQLNYFNPEARDAMRRQLGKVAAHCDGVRCDMAMLVLNDVFERTWKARLHGEWPRLPDEFWPAATRSTPELIYIAEVYWDLESVLLDQGFTFAYDKRLLDALHTADAASRVRQLLIADQPTAAALVRFLENHDEPRSAVTFAASLPAAAALAGTIPGMRFLFDGQQDGRRVRCPVQLARWPDEPTDARVRALYDAVLRFAAKRVLHDGTWGALDTATAGDETFHDILAYHWQTSAALAIVVVNFSAAPAQANIPLAYGLLPDGEAFTFDDALTGEGYRWTREALDRTGLYVRLGAGGAHLFSVQSAS